MNPIFDLLVNTLTERFVAAGFEMPDQMTQKQRESFVIQALEEAAIMPIRHFTRLVAAGREVVTCWESGNLANAVRNLDDALPKEGHAKDTAVRSSL
jgi:hypothetical protein